MDFNYFIEWIYEEWIDNKDSKTREENNTEIRGAYEKIFQVIDSLEINAKERLLLTDALLEVTTATNYGGFIDGFNCAKRIRPFVIDTNN